VQRFCDHRWVGHELRLSRPAFASSSRQGVAVERACTATCMQAKFGCIESARCAYRLACEVVNEQYSQAQAAWSYCLRLRTLWGSARVREIWRHRAQQKNTPMKREAAVAVLVLEGLALVSVTHQ